MTDTVTHLVIGGGAIGLAVARALRIQADKADQVALLEQHQSLGSETSSRNSEVIHAGLYYPKNSLKAKLCVRGKELLYEYCQNNSIPFSRIGKILVAQNEAQKEKLNEIRNQAIENGVTDLQLLSKEKLRTLEPNLEANIGLLSPSTGILSSHHFLEQLAFDIEAYGGDIYVGTRAQSISPINQGSDGFVIEGLSQNQPFTLKAQYLYIFAGLHCQALLRRISGFPESKIPKLYLCRGHYFSYQGQSPFQHLIYPVPNNHGLGIHSTLDLSGQLKFGPDTQYIEEIEYGVSVDRKTAFVDAIRQYFPLVDPDRLQPDYSGIRPKIAGPKDPPADFVIQTESEHGIAGLTNGLGLESPGLTASLAIGEYVAQSIKS